MSLNVMRSTARIGLDAPVRLLHISDVHLSCADARDDERKHALADARRAEYADALPHLRDAFAYAREHGDFIVHTGDMIDFVSHKNLDLARDETAGEDWFFIAGNHEYRKYAGGAFEDETYLQDSLPLVQSAFKRDIRFSSRVVGGVNLVGLDDVYYHFLPAHKALLEAEIRKGLPIVLALHNPLYAPDAPNGGMFYVCAPEEALVGYPPDRRVQMTPTADDRAFFRFLMGERAIKLVLAGHIHEPCEHVLENGVSEWIAGGLCNGWAREITLV